MSTEQSSDSAKKPITNQTWILSCGTCGRWKTLEEVGGLRIGARSIGKRILGRCSSCNRLRWLRLEQPPQIPAEQLSRMVENTG
ncbi:MAG TPA: hypothetical protein VK176_12135 [Phycisphaerales bacterium]|nr:hypothetical protein [Phycisphaerales bacterium]